MLTAMKQELIDDLVSDVVSSIRSRRGRRLDREDLFQTAQLAVLEARLEMPHLDPDHDRSYLRWRIMEAIETQIDPGDGAPAIVKLSDVSDDRTLVVGDVGEEIADRAAAADQVNRMLAGMPADTAAVVRLVFGLGGGLPVAPLDVADILDVTPDEVDGHLWVAECLFRHQADDRRLRRHHPLTEREYRAFLQAGDLAWYDLRELNLNNASLSGCDLSQAVLSGMNLWGVKLVEARAGGINLWGSQLDGADLRGADLRRGILERAGLCGADLRRADLGGANLWSADLSSASADHANLAGADLRGADLRGADLTAADLSGADLRGADLRRARLSAANLAEADLEDAKLAGADLRWADLRRANLVWLDLSVLDLRGASLEGAIRSPKLQNLLSRRAPRPERLRPLAVSA